MTDRRPLVGQGHNAPTSASVWPGRPMGSAGERGAGGKLSNGSVEGYILAAATPDEIARATVTAETAAMVAEHAARQYVLAVQEATTKAVSDNADAFMKLRFRAGDDAAEKELKEMQEWAAKHGSQLLRRCIAEKIKCNTTYRNERLSAERPGWRWYADTPWHINCDGLEDPPATAIALLDEARKTDPDCTLEYVEHETEDENGENIVVRGYCCAGFFLGAKIVYVGSNSPLG